MRILLAFGLLLLVSVSQTQLSSAQSKAPEIISLADSGSTDLTPRIAHKNGITYAAWIQAGLSANGNIAFATRGAGEAQFATPVLLTTSAKVNATLQRGPEFVVTPDGTIHVVWMEEVDIHYSRSVDRGRTWSAPVDISRDDHRATQDFPSIAADSLGVLYVIWVDNRDLIDGKSSNDHIVMTRSSDNGATWDLPRKVENNPGGEGGSCECCRTSIAAAGDGHVFIAYRSNISNRRDIFAARSLNGGAIFETSIALQSKPWHLMSCPATGPLVAVDAEEGMHVVYRTGGFDGKSAVFYNRLRLNDQAPSAEFALGPLGDAANYPAIALSSDGAPVVAYQRSSKIYYRRLGGAGWTDEEEIYSAGKAQRFVWLSAEGNGVAAAWEDKVRDRSDILYTQVPLVQASVRYEGGTGSDEPNFIAKPGDRLLLQVHADRRLEWRVSDATGREVATIVSLHLDAGQEIAVPDLAPGVYYFTCRDRYLYYKILVTR